MSFSVAIDAASPPERSRVREWFRSKKLFSWALVLPATILLTVIAVGPVIYVVILSFSKYTVGQPLEFVGLQNFIRAFQDARFWHGLYITAWFVFFSIGVQLVFGFIAALALQRVNNRFRQIALTFMLVPMMIAPTVVGVLWKIMFKARYGALNYFLEVAFGVQGPDWLADRRRIAIHSSDCYTLSIEEACYGAIRC